MPSAFLVGFRAQRTGKDKNNVTHPPTARPNLHLQLNVMVNMTLNAAIVSARRWLLSLRGKPKRTSPKKPPSTPTRLYSSNQQLRTAPVKINLQTTWCSHHADSDHNCAVQNESLPADTEYQRSLCSATSKNSQFNSPPSPLHCPYHRRYGKSFGPRTPQKQSG